MRTSSVDISQSVKPRRKSAKMAAKAVLGAAAATGAVLYLAQKGKLNPVEGGNKVVESAKAMLKKPADRVLSKASKIAGRVVTASKGNPKISSVLDRMSAIGKRVNGLKDRVVNSGIKGEISKKVDTFKDFVESKFNKDKFSETAKEVATDLFENV